MIACQLAFVTYNQQGLKVRTETRLSGDLIQIGRGSACQIHLPDHRVGLLHATICRDADGPVRIVAADEAIIRIDGFLEQTAELQPGMQIEIGPYQIAVEPAADADLAIVVEKQVADAGIADRVPAAPSTLSALGISKRRIGFGLALIVLLVFLVSMASRVSPGFENWQAGLPVAFTELLNPGPLSAGHGLFGKKCSSCHQHAFEAVADAACTECHQRLASHLDGENRHAGMLAGTPCRDCHPSHKPKAGAMSAGLQQCVACHGQLKTDATDVASIATARDFGKHHPAFQLTVPAGKKVVRVSKDEKEIPPDKSGLKFSHQIHLDKEGVSSPDGRTLMRCGDCHKLEEAGERFKLMTMEMTCQQSRCHKMRYEEPVGGLVPHGSERAVFARLQQFYASMLADEPAELARLCPGIAKQGSVVRRSLDCAEQIAAKRAAATLFRQTGEALECLLCHEARETGKPDAPWKVLPVRTQHDWMPKAVFRHGKHATVECTACHDKTNSQKSEDISFPRIEKCRECHAGEGGAAGRLRTYCEDCHHFHRVSK